MFLSSFLKETPMGSYKAEIHQHATGYSIQYFGPDGKQLRAEDYPGKSIKTVSDLAEGWINSIQVLNG